MTTELPPPFTPPNDVPRAVARTGHAQLDAAGLCTLIGASRHELDALRPGWDALPPDLHLRDGGRYRRRRHACFIVEGDRVERVAHRAHWQPVEYNALHGGFERWFEPIDDAMLAQPGWQRLLVGLGTLFTALTSVPRWYVEAHPFRIDTAGGIGRPTPEGAHRDGVDFVAVLLVARVGVKGGETRVFEAAGPQGLRFTMTEPWTTLLLDDARVIHESTPIQPRVTGHGGHRDTLVLTYRRGSFQGP